MILRVVSPPSKPKDSRAHTVPVSSIAQDECSSQESQIEDGLWEIQHPGIATHKIILWEQRRGMSTQVGHLSPSGQNITELHRSTWEGEEEREEEAQICLLSNKHQWAHSKHLKWSWTGRAPPCQEDAAFHTSIAQIWKANRSSANNTVKDGAKAKSWLSLVQNKGPQLLPVKTASYRNGLAMLLSAF